MNDQEFCAEDRCQWGLDGYCLGRRVPAICGDERYREVARLQAGPFVAGRPGSGPIVSWLSPSCYVGGAERQGLQLMQATKGKIRWGWYGIWCPTRVDPGMRQAIDAHSPVVAGMESIRSMYRGSDVVLRWGYAGVEFRPDPERKYKTVYISHGCGDYTAKVFTQPEDVDGVVAVSEAALDPLPGWAREKAVLVPNGIDLAALEPRPGARQEIRHMLGAGADHRVALWLGRFSAEKGPREWVRGMAETNRRQPGAWKFLALGNGKMLPECRRLAAELGVDVRFVGSRQEVGDFLAAADTLVMTSLEEADSLAALEAMASGVALVTTRVGRVREAAYKRLARLLPLDHTPADIAHALIQDRQRHAETADRVRRARDIVRAHHSAEAMAGRWMTYLKSTFPDLAWTF